MRASTDILPQALTYFEGAELTSLSQAERKILVERAERVEKSKPMKIVSMSLAD